MVKKINIKYLIVVWIIIIFILSSISGNELNKLPKFKIPHLDKIVHFTMYFILQFLVSLEYFKNFSGKYKLSNYILISTLLSIFYGGGIEVMQEYFFTKRSGNIYDLLANSIGAVMGSFILIITVKKTNILNKIIN